MTAAHALALGLVALLATACGTSETPGAPDGTGADGGGAAIEVVLFGDPVEIAGYEELVAAYEDANPGAGVVLSPVAKQDDLLARLVTSFAGGRPPDVFLTNYRKYGQFAAEGVLAPVQQHLDASDVISEDEYAPTALEAFRFDGEELTCMPQNVSSLVVYYNADRFADAGVPAPAAGWTWDDFLAAARQLTTGDSWGVGVAAELIRVAPFVWSNGGEVTDEEITPTRLTLDEPAAREAVDWFLDLQLEHGVVPPDAEERSMDAESRFIAGGLGMYLDSRRVVPGLREAAAFEWDVAPLPVAPGGEPATILHGDAYCMAAEGNVEAAWDFVEFAMGIEGQTILAASGRTVPSRLDVAQSEAFLDPAHPPASSQVFLDVIPTIRSVPRTAAWVQVEKQADAVLSDAFYGRIPREAAIDQLIATTTPLLGAGG